MLLGMVVGAVVCYLIASRNNMSTIWWPMFGFILPILATLVTIAVAVLRSRRSTNSDTEPQEAPTPV